MPELADWDSFYVIVGSSAGGLIGLQFVVLTLIAQKPPRRAAEGSAAFATPTVVHFATVLLLAAALRAPWHAITPIAAIWGLIGLAGIVYACIVTRRMRRQTSYKPELEDWLFHVVLPLAAYITLAVSALAAPSDAREALFGAGTAALLLLFIGIHNAWDATVYHVFVSMAKPDD
jgi:Flp pilus assembly protein TadB